MRIGYLGYFNIPFATEWEVATALEKRAEVDRYAIEDFDRKKFTKREYDICLTPHAHLQPMSFWNAQKGLKIAHYFDLVVGWMNRERLYFPPLKDFDLVLSPDGFNGTKYDKAGINRKFFEQAGSPDNFVPCKSRKMYDLGFIGHPYKNRAGLFREFGRRYNFKNVGLEDECRGGHRHSEFCAKCKIMFATNARNDVPGYWSIRIYHHLLSRAFVIHPHVKGLERYFEDGKHLVMWEDERDLFEKIDYYLAHPEERDRIAKAGHDLVMKRDTWDVRMEEFWNFVSDLSPTRTLRAESESLAGSSSNTSMPTVSFPLVTE